MKAITDSQKERLDENFANYNVGAISYEKHEEIRSKILNN